jgi:hypothetical protein
MCCVAHIINLIVRDGINVMDKDIKRVGDSVGFLSATPKRHEHFESIAAQMNIKYEKRIALDCKIRWNSAHLMLSTILEYQIFFEWLASKENLCALFQPNKNDWNFAWELCARLKMFYNVIGLLSDTNYVIIKLFFPKICGI